MSALPMPTGFDPVSAGISFVSNIAGGLLGGKKKRGPSFEDQLVMRGRALDADVNNKISVGKKYGIHPLTMLGVQSPYQPSSSMSTDTSHRETLGESIAQAGTDLSRAVSAGRASPMEKLQERLLLAQIEGQEIDNVTRASMYARSTQPGNPPMASTITEKISNMKLNQAGMRDAAVPMHTIGYDEEGDPVRFYNEDLGDNETMQAIHAMRYSIPDYLGNKIKRGARKFATVPFYKW